MNTEEIMTFTLPEGLLVSRRGSANQWRTDTQHFDIQAATPEALDGLRQWAREVVEALPVRAEFLGYVRASMSDPDGVDTQRKAIDELASKLGIEVEHVEEDIGVPGAMLGPNLHAALDRMSEGSGLVVAGLDRIARTPHLVVEVFDRARSEGWAIISSVEGIDTRSYSPLKAELIGKLAEFGVEERQAEARQAEHA